MFFPRPDTAASAAFFGSVGIFRLLAKSLVEPEGIYPTLGSFGRPMIPETTLFKVPSPPLQTIKSMVSPNSDASLPASSGPWVIWTRGRYPALLNTSRISKSWLLICSRPERGLIRNNISFIYPTVLHGVPSPPPSDPGLQNILPKTAGMPETHWEGRTAPLIPSTLQKTPALPLPKGRRSPDR